MGPSQRTPLVPATLNRNGAGPNSLRAGLKFRSFVASATLHSTFLSLYLPLSWEKLTISEIFELIEAMSSTYISCK